MTHHCGRLVADLGARGLPQRHDDLLHPQVVVAEPVDVQPVLPVLGQQIRDAVLLIDADVAADVTQRPLAADVAVRPDGVVGDGVADPGVTVVVRLDVQEHHPGAVRAAQHLWPLDDAVGAQVGMVLRRERVALEPPLPEIGRRVAGDGGEQRAVGLVLAPRVPALTDAQRRAAVQLRHLAAVVDEHLAGPDRVAHGDSILGFRGAQGSSSSEIAPGGLYRYTIIVESRPAATPIPQEYR